MMMLVLHLVSSRLQARGGRQPAVYSGSQWAVGDANALGAGGLWRASEGDLKVGTCRITASRLLLSFKQHSIDAAPAKRRFASIALMVPAGFV
ncbi:hypothetical protein GGI42DRAFT_312855 [Trichoderma sp. SZMC 28013]